MLATVHMAQQIARFWTRKSVWAGGLVFAEPDQDAPANIYACPLPDARFRLEPAASIVHIPSAAAEPMDAMDRAAFTVTCQARTRAEAFTLAGDFARTLWPDKRPSALVDPLVVLAPMLIGVPDGADLAWRFIEIRRLQAAQVVPGPGINQRSGDGLETVQQSFEAYAVDEEINWPE